MAKKRKREEVPRIAIAVGKAIARQRRLVGLTQREVAEIIDTGVETISRLEAGNILQTVDRLEQLSSALNCPITSFFLQYNDDERTQIDTVAYIFKTLSLRQKEKFLSCITALADVLKDK